MNPATARPLFRATLRRRILSRTFGRTEAAYRLAYGVLRAALNGTMTDPDAVTLGRLICIGENEAAIVAACDAAKRDHEKPRPEGPHNHDMTPAQLDRWHASQGWGG